MDEPTQQFSVDQKLDRLLGLVEQVVDRVDGIDGRLTSVEATLADFGDRLTSVEATLAGFGDRLTSVETTLAARALETRPMSEKIDRLLAEVVELTERSRDYDRSLSRVQKDTIRRYDDADERIQRLEERAR